MVIVHHCDAAVRMRVNPASGLGGSPKREAITLERLDELMDREISEEMNEGGRLVHMTTASAGASMISPLAGGFGIGLPISRSVVI